MRPEKAVMFDALEFQSLFASAVEISHRLATELNRPALKESRKKKQYFFNNVPINRLGSGMEQRFQNDPEKYFSFMWRWFAFVELVHSDVLDDEFCQKSNADGERNIIHPAAVHLAGSFPMNADGKFNHDAFLVELRKKFSENELRG